MPKVSTTGELQPLLTVQDKKQGQESDGALVTVIATERIKALGACAEIEVFLVNLKAFLIEDLSALERLKEIEEIVRRAPVVNLALISEVRGELVSLLFTLSKVQLQSACHLRHPLFFGNIIGRVLSFSDISGDRQHFWKEKLDQSIQLADLDIAIEVVGKIEDESVWVRGYYSIFLESMFGGELHRAFAVLCQLSLKLNTYDASMMMQVFCAGALSCREEELASAAIQELKSFEDSEHHLNLALFDMAVYMVANKRSREAINEIIPQMTDGEEKVTALVELGEMDRAMIVIVNMHARDLPTVSYTWLKDLFFYALEEGSREKACALAEFFPENVMKAEAHLALGELEKVEAILLRIKEPGIQKVFYCLCKAYNKRKDRRKVQELASQMPPSVYKVRAHLLVGAYNEALLCIKELERQKSGMSGLALLYFTQELFVNGELERYTTIDISSMSTSPLKAILLYTTDRELEVADVLEEMTRSGDVRIRKVLEKSMELGFVPAMLCHRACDPDPQMVEASLSYTISYLLKKREFKSAKSLTLELANTPLKVSYLLQIGSQKEAVKAIKSSTDHTRFHRSLGWIAYGRHLLERGRFAEVEGVIKNKLPNAHHKMRLLLQYMEVKNRK